MKGASAPAEMSLCPIPARQPESDVQSRCSYFVSRELRQARPDEVLCEIMVSIIGSHWQIHSGCKLLPAFLYLVSHDGITILLDVHDFCSVELCEIARNYYREGEFSLPSI